MDNGSYKRFIFRILCAVIFVCRCVSVVSEDSKQIAKCHGYKLDTIAGTSWKEKVYEDRRKHIEALPSQSTVEALV